MPATMRGTKPIDPRKTVGRYFAGKGQDHPGSDESEEQEEEEKVAERKDGKTETKVDIKVVDLQEHFERDRILESQRREIEAADEPNAGSEYETDDNGEEETGSSSEEEEEAPRRVLQRPTFLTKDQREAKASTATLKEKATEADESLEAQQKRRSEARKLIEEQIRLEVATKSGKDAVEGEEDIDDTDDVDVEAERAAWKLRELLRIKREREAIESRERERDEIESRRAMPEEQRLQEDVARVNAENEEKLARRRAEREEMDGARNGKFHHHGGFYQDDPVVKQSLLSAGGKIEDTQAGIGLRGATRWNGLINQDTSSRDSLWRDSTHDGNKRKNGDVRRDDTKKRRS